MDRKRLYKLKTLSQELGPIGMIRFLQQLETGAGDYTKERQLREDRIDAAMLAAQIQAWQASELTMID